MVGLLNHISIGFAKWLWKWWRRWKINFEIYTVVITYPYNYIPDKISSRLFVKDTKDPWHIWSMKWSCIRELLFGPSWHILKYIELSYQHSRIYLYLIVADKITLTAEFRSSDSNNLVNKIAAETWYLMRKTVISRFLPFRYSKRIRD